MTAKMKAIETTGIVDKQHHLHLDSPLPIMGTKRVRVIVLLPEQPIEEWNEGEWLKASTTNPSFDFLKELAEDIYTLKDGKPFHDKR